MILELEDGVTYQGYSFGSPTSIAGELVFQTGMVGYPESITDPSYRGQILVITFPLVGNYGVPSREAVDDLLPELPAHFEAAEIHIAGLVVASYSGEEYSHYLAKSSLGVWLKEQGIPAMHGVDTRALTKKIRKQGSMLGKLLLELGHGGDRGVGGAAALDAPDRIDKLQKWQSSYESIEWVDPNESNLVDAGREDPRPLPELPSV
jgi:carbamoyl-phosphate synthase/aspartate carbamoyltransferase